MARERGPRGTSPGRCARGRDGAVVMTEAEGLAFERTARAIRDDVTSGVLTPDDRVPSEVELRERCGVSMPTVTCAVALLKAWGVVETQVGSGTRVVDPARGVQVSGPDEHTERMRRGRPIYASGERSAIYAAGVVSSAAACQVSGQIRSRRWHVA